MKCTLLFPIITTLLLLNACQDQKQKEKDDQQVAATDSFDTSLRNIKIYVSELDSALIKFSRLNTADSVKRELRSRDQDMVRIYKTEQPPLVDTAAENTDVKVREASRILADADALVESARQQIKSEQQRSEIETLNSGDKVRQEHQAHIKKVQELILKIERETETLRGEIERMTTP